MDLAPLNIHRTVYWTLDVREFSWVPLGKCRVVRRIGHDRFRENNFKWNVHQSRSERHYILRQFTASWNKQHNHIDMLFLNRSICSQKSQRTPRGSLNHISEMKATLRPFKAGNWPNVRYFSSNFWQSAILGLTK